jgi:enoyl-CoA hydratase/carnithine racemase
VRLTKALLKKPIEAAMSLTIEEEIRIFIELLKSPAAAEAFHAFLEKRKPDFSRFS